MNRLGWTTLILTAVLSTATAWSEKSPVPFAPTDTLAGIQEKIAQNGYQFTVATNWVFNLSPEEKARMFKRRKPADPALLTVLPDAGPLIKLLNEPLPASFSWTNSAGLSYIGPVRHQGDCGSCYAFGACAAAENVYNRFMGLTGDDCVDLSEAFLIWCLGGLPEYNAHFYGCDGADYDYAELQALSVYGVPNESDFPYQITEPEACAAWSAPRIRFAGWYRVPCNDIDAIKAAIMNYGVVPAAVLTTPAFEAYSSGVYEDTNTECDFEDCAYTTTDHGISLVGWDDNGDAENAGYWILRNSWGEQWGEGGYMRIRYRSAAVACAVTYLTYATPVTALAGPDGMVLQWPGREAYTYDIDVATNLVHGFVPLATNLSGQASLNSYTDTVTGAASRFYQIKTHQP